MAKITNVSPVGDLDVPLLGRIVHAGETVEVTDDQAATLAAQASNWQAVTDSQGDSGGPTTAAPEAAPSASDSSTETPTADPSAATDTTSTEGSEH